MIRILIADDHLVVRQGLKQIVSEEPDMVVVGEAGNSDELLNQARSNKWDVLILDISMPGRSGIDILKDLKREWPKSAIVILSTHPEDQFAVRALKSGAAGYLTKESAAEELLRAIRKVYTGGKYISETLAEHLAISMDKVDNEPPHTKLSNRELEIVRMIASGKTVTEIAESLSLSVKTVSTYRTRALDKMNMRTNAELTRYAVKHRLIT